MPAAQPDNLQADSLQADSRRASEHLRWLREKAMKLKWVGQPYEKLVQQLGAPVMFMIIPAYRPWLASVAVYERQDIDGCIDAFVVEHGGKPVIYDYFCR